MPERTASRQSVLRLAPAGGGKTRRCLDQVREVLRAAPLAEVWAVLPDRRQAVAFRQALAEAGGAIGARVGTFADLYAEVLAQAGREVPVAPGPLIHRLIRAAVDTLAARDALPHYLPIQRRPGFVAAAADLIAELKRARIEPPIFTAAARGRGARLEELAALYEEYQAALIRLNWADGEGLGWLAVQALQADPSLALGWQLLVVDGFDSFIPTQLEMLTLLQSRVERLIITLTGAPGPTRPAHRRFARTLERIQAALDPAVEALPVRVVAEPNLAHLEAALFEPDPAPAASTGAVTFQEVQTVSLEAREALRWVKARIVRDGVPPGECAIVARDIEPYRPWLRQAAAEMGLPLRFTGGEPLESSPAITALLGLLELPLQDWPWRPVLDAVRSPYFDMSRLGLSPHQADALAAVARWAQVVSGLEQWQEALGRLAKRPGDPESGDEDPDEENRRPPGLPAGEAARRLAASLSALAERLAPPREGMLHDYVGWLEGLLSDEEGLGLPRQIGADAETVQRDTPALRELYKVLQALVLSERIAGTASAMTFSDFFSELRGAIAAAEYVPDGEDAPVQARIYAASLAAARGVPRRAVALLGLSEGLFPAPVREDPFLSDDDREALQAAGLRLEPRLRSDELTFFYEAVTRATEHLLLSRPYLADDGERWEPSPYWAAALSLLDVEPATIRPGVKRPLAEAASPVELLAEAVAARALPRAYASLEPHWQTLQRAGAVLGARLARAAKGEHEGQLDSLGAALNRRFGPAYLWSASRLEAFGACGFRFFADTALRLEPRDTPVAGYDPAQRGSMLHEILEQVLRRAADPADLESVLAALPAVADEVFDAAPEIQGFRPSPLWHAERAELLAVLTDTLRALDEKSRGWRPLRLEARFGFEDAPPLEMSTAAGPVRLRGVIDRVDANPEGRLRVIDYKSGSGGPGRDELRDGKSLQVALYAAAVERALGLGEVSEGLYWMVRGAKAAPLQLARFSAELDGQERSGAPAALEAATQHVGNIVAKVRAGRFEPAPPDDGCPDYCPARTFCWRYSPREW